MLFKRVINLCVRHNKWVSRLTEMDRKGTETDLRNYRNESCLISVPSSQLTLPYLTPSPPLPSPHQTRLPTPHLISPRLLSCINVLVAYFAYNDEFYRYAHLYSNDIAYISSRVVGVEWTDRHNIKPRTNRATKALKCLSQMVTHLPWYNSTPQ